MTKTSNYTYHQIAAHELSATDLNEELRTNDEALNGPGETYAIVFYDDHDQCTGGETAEALYFPKIRRLGVAWGAEAAWADVPGLDEGIRMWATDPEAWEAAN